MFEPKMNTSINLVCTENPSKELNYLLNQEFNLLRERQEMKQAQAEILKVKEQEQKENTEKARADDPA
jgi:hypothetical protein